MSTDVTTTRPRPGMISHPVAPVPAAPIAPITQQLRIPIPAEPPKIANMAKAIAGVMANIGAVHKGGYNSFHDYKYARMEDLLAKLTPLMGRNGLAIIQNEVEVKMVEQNRVAVTYEFSILHESGEMWPERPRFTGMAMARDRRGNVDDKSLNKCHTAARKYFLLSLFQVPTSDVDDADETERQQPGQQEERVSTQQDRRVPGPGSAPTQTQAASRQAAQQPPPGPRKIVLGGSAGAEEWKRAYLEGVVTAKTRDEVLAWDALNDMALQLMHQKHPEISAQIMTAVEKHIDNIEGSPAREVPPVDTNFGMPPPRERPAEAMAWIVAKLGEFKHYEAAENFWNQVVAPRENDFAEGDWENLMLEWRRTEARLGSTQEEGTEA